MNLLQGPSPVSAISSQPAGPLISSPGPLDFLPLIHPEPPRLSQHAEALREIEAAGVYSNYGPMNTLLESEFIQQIFGSGSCLTVCNATIGLMLAIQEVLPDHRPASRRYALMPSFTFAATAQAALWCGLTPLFCDIDPHTWLPDMNQIKDLLRQYAGQIAVMVPYATFGNNLDLQEYARLAEASGVPVVVDAAASLGSLDDLGSAFGTGFPWTVVFSMHATKVFSVGEGGLLYSADPDRIARLRAMGSFGFLKDRSAHMMGLNSKMSEVTALIARLQLRRYEGVLLRCEALAIAYRERLRDTLELQQAVGMRQARSFQPILLPRDLGRSRAEVLESLALAGVGAGSYFSPHVAQQPFFQGTTLSAPLPVTEDIASRVVSLPLRGSMTVSDVERIVAALELATGLVSAETAPRTSLPFALPSTEETGTATQHHRAA